MGEVFGFDEYNFALCALVTVGMQLAFFAVAYLCQFDKVTDFAGSTNFSLLAVLTLALSGEYWTRQLLVTGMVLVTRTELAFYLLARVCSRGKDARFDEMRKKFFAFLGFWIFQMIWAFGVMVSVIFVNGAKSNPDIEIRDYIGVLMFAFGFLYQTGADLQKYAFRKNKANKGKMCRTWLWAWSRHPNYFGEMMIWWGIFVTCTPVFDEETSGYITIISPLLTMAILLFLSGMTIAERDSAKRYLKPGDPLGYVAYRNRVSPLIPVPQCLYGALPLIVKRIMFFEFPIYDIPGDVEKREEEGRYAPPTTDPETLSS